MTAVLEAHDLSVRLGRTLVIDGVTLRVDPAETVALVGESGSGKTTTALTLVRAYVPHRGRVVFEGRDITHLPERRLRQVRRRVQFVFQDPYASLDPRMPVERIVAEPLRAHLRLSRADRRARVRHLLQAVGLPADSANRLPSQFSGGQRQRIAIARALALDPLVVVADEPVSALDVSIQAQIVNLLDDLQRERRMAYLVITHNLALMHHLAGRVLVMYLGRVVEEGPTVEVVRWPLHPYTAALLAAAPDPDSPRRRERIVLTGDPPSLVARPHGCEFHPRCPIARGRCRIDVPELVEVAGRTVRCFYPGELPGIGADDVMVTIGEPPMSAWPAAPDIAP